MIKKIIGIFALMFLLSGCYMIPMAFIGPATSSFSTASIIQSTITTSASYMVKKTTGKSITEHLIENIDEETLQSSFAPKQNKSFIILPKIKPNF